MRGRQLHFFNSEDEKGSANRRRTVILPLDTLILLVIVMVLLLVLAFSMGVEKGRENSYANAEKNNSEAKNIIIPDTKLENVINKTEIEKQKIDKKIISPQAQVKKEETIKIVSENKKTENITQGYVIQVASYTKENFAQDEARKLQNKGFPTLIARKNNFVALYVGRFKSKEEAERNMGLLKKTYKDCILRKNSAN